MDLFKRDNLPSMASSLASSMAASMTPLIPVTSLGSIGSLPGGMQYKPMTSFGLVSSLAEPMLTNPVTHSHPVTIPQLPRPVPLQGSTGLPITPGYSANSHHHQQQQQQLQNHHQHNSQESGHHHHGGLQPSPTSHHIPIQASSPDLSDNLSTSSTSSGELSGGASGSGSSQPKRGKGKGVPYIPSYMDLSNGPEPCVVCGDAATGYHYRCMTCEGCKGFFRRTIQKNLQYHCKWNKNCVIDKTTRNQCQECRFIKCLNVGMATDLVLNEKQRTAKRKLIEENRVKRKEEQQKQRVRDPSGDPEVLSDQDRWLICEVVTAYEYTAGKVQNSLKGEYDGMSTDLQSQDPESWQGLAEAMTPSIIKVVEFAKSIPGFTELNVDDQILLLKSCCMEVMCLRAACRFDPEAETLTLYNGMKLHKSQIHKDGLAVLVEPIIDLIILNVDDQILLLKSCCMEVMCLRAACRFDPEAETLTLYNGMKLHKSQIHKDGLAVLVEPIFDFAVGLAKLKLDKAELALLASILLMQSDRSGLKEPENVEKLQDAILGAFKRYVAENRPHQPVHWAKILMKVTDLRTISTRHAERVLCIRLDNSGEIPPLLLEVFNEGHAVSS